MSDGNVRDFNKEKVKREEHQEYPRIAKLNDDFAVITVGGGVAILRENMGEDGSDFVLWNKSDLKLWLENQPAVEWEQDGRKKLQTLADYWLSHPARRQYEHGIIFSPGKTLPGSFYNLWKGFAVGPGTGDGSGKGCDLFLAHIRENVAQNDPMLYSYVIGWFAQILQQPDRKIGVSLILRGLPGVGKSIVGKIIGELLGKHFYQAAEQERITGRFNAHIAATILLQSDEAFWAGDKKAESKLKDLITGTEQTIEFKGEDVIRVKNYIRLFGTSNETWVVPVGLGDRRFAVLDVGGRHKEDHPYFEALVNQMKAGGYEALLDYLLAFDLTKVNLWELPKTEAYLEQKMESMNAEEKWWCAVLRDGALPDGSARSDSCPKDTLLRHYLEHSRRVGYTRRANETRIAMFLKKMAPGLTDSKESKGRSREPTWNFPSLKECRQEMSKQVGQDMNWCDPEAEWEKRNFDPPPREQVIVVNGVSDFPAGFGGTSPKGKHQGEFK